MDGQQEQVRDPWRSKRAEVEDEEEEEESDVKWPDCLE